MLCPRVALAASLGIALEPLIEALPAPSPLPRGPRTIRVRRRPIVSIIWVVALVIMVCTIIVWRAALWLAPLMLLHRLNGGWLLSGTHYAGTWRRNGEDWF